MFNLVKSLYLYCFGISIVFILSSCGGGGGSAGNGNSSVSLVPTGDYYVSVMGNDGNDGLSSTNPKLTIQAAIAAAPIGKNVHVTEGSYQLDSNAGSGNQVVLRDNVSLYGGYSSDFTVRDPSVYTTIIEDISTTTGTIATLNRTIESNSGVTNNTLVDGFTINGSSGASADYSAAIANFYGGAPTIQNNIISGGSEPYSYGIYNLNSSPVIQNNTIAAGTGSISYGVYSRTSSPIIQRNIITGGSGATDSIAVVSLVSSSSIIRNNVIRGGSGSNSSNAVIDANLSFSTIRNNSIDGGTGVSSHAIMIMESSPTIQNNILYTSAGTNRYCLSEWNNINSDPAQFTNNNLFACPTALYHDEAIIEIITISEVNALLDITGGTSGNISVDPLFVSADDLHLTVSSPASVTQGGLEFSTYFTNDKDGLERTIPWSIGAYEY